MAGDRRKWPLAFDLFSGCGGLTLGLKQAHFRVIGAVDNDPLSVETYKANHERIRVWETDIRKLPAARVMRELRIKRGELDLLAGCPPCQGYSSLRNLNGSRRVRDARNSLLFEFLRFASVMRPKSIMMENVPGLAGYYRFKEFTRKLKRLGYIVHWDVLDAADYGVPQRRKRLVLLACRRGKMPFAERMASRKTVEDAIRHLPQPRSSTGDPLHRRVSKRSKRIEDLIRAIPRDGGSRNNLGHELQLRCHRRTDGFKDVYGRMAWRSQAPTITSGCLNPSKGRFLHPSQNRSITLREAALLQSFPPEYRISLRAGAYAAAVMVGNALPPAMTRAQARVIRQWLNADHPELQR